MELVINKVYFNVMGNEVTLIKILDRKTVLIKGDSVNSKDMRHVVMLTDDFERNYRYNEKDVLISKLKKSQDDLVRFIKTLENSQKWIKEEQETIAELTAKIAKMS